MDPVMHTAWQPITPRGVAQFARAPTGRLLLAQSVFALLAAATVTWCVNATWFPTLRAAITHLPDRGEIRSGRLDWNGASPQSLAEGHFLSVVVDAAHGGELRSPAHVQMALGRETVRVFSLFGYAELRYPRGWSVALNRPGAEPWWGAWSPFLLAGVFAGTALSLAVSWTLLALVYCLPVWLAGFFTNRALDLPGAWRLSGAAQLPGALFFTVAVFFYGAGFMDPVRLLVAGGVHFVMTWVYLGVSLVRLPAADAAFLPGRNPFAGDRQVAAHSGKPNAENPFSTEGRRSAGIRSDGAANGG